MALQVLHHNLPNLSDVGLHIADVIADMPNASIQFAKCFQHLAAGDGLIAVFASAGEHPDRCQDTDPHRPNSRNHCLHRAIL